MGESEGKAGGNYSVMVTNESSLEIKQYEKDIVRLLQMRGKYRVF